MVRLQSVARGRQLRQKKAAFEFEYKATRACIRIQSAFRARRSRKHVNAKRHARQEKETRPAKEAEAAKKAAKAQKKAQKKAEGEGGGAGNSREPSRGGGRSRRLQKATRAGGGFKPGKGASPPQSPPKPGHVSRRRSGTRLRRLLSSTMSSPDIGSSVVSGAPSAEEQAGLATYVASSSGEEGVARRRWEWR